jgi:hypothetical protein
LVVKRARQRTRDRVAGVGEDLVGEVLAEFSPEMPFALAMLDRVPERGAATSICR